MADMGAHGIGWVHFDTKIPYGERGRYNGLTNGNISKMEVLVSIHMKLHIMASYCFTKR